MDIKDLINSRDFKEYLKDVGDIEEGGHYKHDMCLASLMLKIEKGDVERYPELKDYVGFIAKQEGTISYSNGWDSYADVHLYEEALVQTQMSSDFWSLMEHLNSEGNGMAEDFANKYLKDIKEWREIH